MSECTHDLAERETACADGMCPLCLAAQLTAAERDVAELKDFAIWMTGCGYDFAALPHFCKQRDKFLLNFGAALESGIDAASEEKK